MPLAIFKTFLFEMHVHLYRELQFTNTSRYTATHPQPTQLFPYFKPSLSRTLASPVARSVLFALA